MSFKVDILLRFKSVFSKSNFFFPFRVRKISLNHPKCPIFHDSNDTSHTSVPPNHAELLHFQNEVFILHWKCHFKVKFVFKLKIIFSKLKFFFSFQIHKIPLNHLKCPIFYHSNDTLHTHLPPNHAELLHFERQSRYSWSKKSLQNEIFVKIEKCFFKVEFLFSL